MATLIEVYNQKATNADLRNRVVAAVAVAAWNIFEEATPTDARITWAKDAISNAESIGGNWMWAVTGNTAIQAANFAPTDADIQYVVNTLRDKFAI